MEEAARRCWRWWRGSRPSAPTCCIMLIEPRGEAGFLWLYPQITAAMVTGTMQTQVIRGGDRRTSPVQAASRPALSKPAGRVRLAAAHDQRRLEAVGVTACEGESAGQDAVDRRRQVGDAGLERRVVQHLLHVQRQQQTSAKIDPPSRRPVAFDPERVRRRKMRSGSSGAGERTSIAKNATSATAAPASSSVDRPSPALLPALTSSRTPAATGRR